MALVILPGVLCSKDGLVNRNESLADIYLVSVGIKTRAAHMLANIRFKVFLSVVTSSLPVLCVVSSVAIIDTGIRTSTWVSLEGPLQVRDRLPGCAQADDSTLFWRANI